MDANTNRSLLDWRISQDRKNPAIVAPIADIHLQVAIHADRRRILDAMTMPEYIEAWMSPTDSNTQTSVSALRIEDRFRIDFHRSGALDSSVTGSFQIYMLDKLIFTWRRFGPVEDARSIVNIVLHKDKTGSTLELRHTGLPSVEEKLWHQNLWRTSLHNLARLFA